MPFSDIRAHTFSNQDKLIFDTNICLYLWGPQEINRNNYRVEVYSVALKRMLGQGAKLFLLPIVLSEFIKTLESFEFEKYKERSNLPIEFRHFIQMEVFVNARKEIAPYIREMLQVLEPITMSIGEISDCKKLIDGYSFTDVPINDLLISKACQRRGINLVTDDRDFRSLDTGIRIYTANPNILTP